MPRVSVIIPTYNRARYLCEAIDSVLRQTYQDFEIIIVDDGSTDDTKAVVAKYGASVRYIYQPHRGSSEARNSALRVASSEFIAFLDSDDVWFPEKLKKQIAVLDADTSAGLVYTFTEIIDEEGQLLPRETRKRYALHRKGVCKGYSYEAMSELCVLWPSTVVVRKKCLDKVGFFDPQTEAFEDWDLYLRISLEYQLVGVWEPLVRFRIHENHRTSREFVEGRINTALKHLSLLEARPDLPFQTKAKRNFFLQLAAAYYMTPTLEKCRKFTIEAFKLGPLSVLEFHSLKRFFLSWLGPVLNWLRQGKDGFVPLVTVKWTNGNIGNNNGKGKKKAAEFRGFDERVIPDETDKGIVSIHLQRYLFAEPFCHNKQVLDVACGVGYGTAYLSDFAARATGVDLSSEAITYAKSRYQKANTIFERMDACRLTFENEAFDVVVSFETIEHLRDIDAYLGGIVRVLKSDGVYLVSTPCVKETVDKPDNPFHFQEWSPEDFKRLLSQYFSSVTLFGQKRKQTKLHRWLQKADFLNLHQKIHVPVLTNSLSYAVGTTPFAEMDLRDLEIVEDNLNGAIWMIGVCSGSKRDRNTAS